MTFLIEVIRGGAVAAEAPQSLSCRYLSRFYCKALENQAFNPGRQSSLNDS